MQLSVFLIVLFSAALHATWNTVVKGGTDKMQTTVLVTAMSGAVAAAVLPFLEPPARSAWAFLAASAGVQLLYFVAIANVYRITDMSRAYPLMRGLAPAIVAVLGLVFLGETLSGLAWTSIALICCGVFGIALTAGGSASRLGVSLAVANAGIIASYTLIDGAGVRTSGAPASYALWLFLLNAAPLLGWMLLTRGRAFIAYAERNLALALVGGVANLGAYGLALWAMTAAPVAQVAALRETSILFGLAMAALVLGEPVDRGRLLGGVLIAAGAIGLRFA